ncbi:hypothetical protein [Escherichia coli]|uniref:hypothetical protein n=2 Tax=Escherichia coli TaxID=562 RepID=UPI0011782B9E|nr:hypothetical protein [Escherichia coli]
MTNQKGSSHKAANKPFNPLKILDFIIKKAKAVKFGSSHKAANKPFNPLKILDFIIKKAKAVKLSPILSTSWAGTVEVLAAKRKDRILTLSATVTCPHD